MKKLIFIFGMMLFCQGCASNMTDQEIDEAWRNFENRNGGPLWMIKTTNVTNNVVGSEIKP